MKRPRAARTHLAGHAHPAYLPQADVPLSQLDLFSGK